MNVNSKFLTILLISLLVLNFSLGFKAYQILDVKNAGKHIYGKATIASTTTTVNFHTGDVTETLASVNQYTNQVGFFNVDPFDTVRFTYGDTLATGDTVWATLYPEGGGLFKLIAFEQWVKMKAFQGPSGDGIADVELSWALDGVRH